MDRLWVLTRGIAVYITSENPTRRCFYGKLSRQSRPRDRGCTGIGLAIVVNVISPFPQTVLLPPPLEIYVSLSLTSLVGLMISLMISCLTANSDQANSIIHVILNIPNPLLRRDLQADRLWGGIRRIVRDALVDDRYRIVGWFDRVPDGVRSQRFLFPLCSRYRACSGCLVRPARDDRHLRRSHHVLLETQGPVRKVGAQ